MKCLGCTWSGTVSATQTESTRLARNNPVHTREERSTSSWLGCCSLAYPLPRSTATRPLPLGSQMNKSAHFTWNYQHSKAPRLDRGQHTCHITAGHGPAQWPPLPRPHQHTHRRCTSELLDGACTPSTCLTQAPRSDHKDLGLPGGGRRRGIGCMTMHATTCPPGPQPPGAGPGGHSCLRARGTHPGNPPVTGFTGWRVRVATHGCGVVTDARRSRTPRD